MKREFVLLAHPLNVKKHVVGGSYMSEKLDGVRAVWDGGVSRGMFSDEIPWANTAKDHIRVKKPIATGLWSRYGNVIHAPDWFLDSLPPYILDGELYAGPRGFQKVTSITGSYVPGLGWKQIQYMVFDSPKPDVIFGNGVINNTNYKKTFTGCYEWICGRNLATIPESRYYDFRTIYSWLERNLPQDGYAKLAHQEQLPMQTDKAIVRMNERLDEVIDAGGEGLVLRRPSSMWLPERSHDCLKYKPHSDAEGIVVGYVFGRETALGSKLLGLMGALILNFNGKRLELSGFTNEEREMTYYPKPGSDSARDPYNFPGREASQDWTNLNFPRGSKVTFKYRELSDAGIPKEARFFRKRPNGI